jgi:cell division protein FtsZ
MLFRTGLINLDFATLRQAFATRGGKTLFGLGDGAGENAVADAVASLKLCPLLATPEFSRKADRLLVNIVGGADLTLPKVNELMTAVAEQFGKESHIIMGAVIDEQMQGRVEVCVLGTSDMGGRGAVRRPPLPARAKTPPARPAESAVVTAAVTPAHLPANEPATTTHAAAVQAAKAEQNEFSFGEIESRGHFDKTDRNLFEGQDLDVPTYLRKGIKIVLLGAAGLPLRGPVGPHCLSNPTRVGEDDTVSVHDRNRLPDALPLQVPKGGPAPAYGCARQPASPHPLE